MFHKGEIFFSIIRIDKYSVYTRCAIWITGRKCKFIAFLSLTNTWYYLFYVARKKIKKTFWFVVCSWFCGSAHLHDIQSLFSSTFFSFSCCLFCFVCKESLDRFPLSQIGMDNPLDSKGISLALKDTIYFTDSSSTCVCVSECGWKFMHSQQICKNVKYNNSKQIVRIQCQRIIPSRGSL